MSKVKRMIVEILFIAFCALGLTVLFLGPAFGAGRIGLCMVGVSSPCNSPEAASLPITPPVPTAASRGLGRRADDAPQLRSFDFGAIEREAEAVMRQVPPPVIRFRR